MAHKNTDTAATVTGTLDLRGHAASVTADTVILGQDSSTGSSASSSTGTIHFEDGTFSVTSLQLGNKTNSASSRSAAGVLNMSGGAFTVNSGGLFRLSNRSGSSGTASGTVNVTGGTLTSNVGITDGGQASATSTLALDGGTLDMVGNAIGNEEWVNPHDPEAKVGRTKDGATDMIYKPEHVSDLESGAIIRAEVRPGNAGDTEALSERVAEAIQTLGEVTGEEDLTKLGKEVCADEGYFALREIGQLQAMEIRAVISDPQARRRRKELPAEDQAILRRAQRAVRSASGKKLLRKRGEHLERGFCHVLDHGGRRRATLRGCENLTKAYYGAALAHNLSLLMRHLHGCGTPKQWVAGVFLALLRWLGAVFARLRDQKPSTSPKMRHRPAGLLNCTHFAFFREAQSFFNRLLVRRLDPEIALQFPVAETPIHVLGDKVLSSAHPAVVVPPFGE